jgi:hypothetical protein
MTYGAARAGTWQDSPPRQGPQQGSHERGPGQQHPNAPGQPGQRARRVAALQATLGALFPVAEERPAARRLASATLQVAAVCAGAVVLLLRVPGTPAWDSIYAEDKGLFLEDALTRPWHLLTPYNGYEQLGPRLIGQLIASFLPLVYASDGYAIAGALIGAASAVFIYHASEGCIRSRWLRALTGAALLLLPVALMDIADSGVDSPWYTCAHSQAGEITVGHWMLPETVTIDCSRLNH